MARSEQELEALVRGDKELAEYMHKEVMAIIDDTEREANAELKAMKADILAEYKSSLEKAKEEQIAEFEARALKYYYRGRSTGFFLASAFYLFLTTILYAVMA